MFRRNYDSCWKVSTLRHYTRVDHSIAFSVVTLDKCIRNFSSFTGCSLGEAIKCATYNPAKSVISSGVLLLT